MLPLQETFAVVCKMYNAVDFIHISTDYVLMVMEPGLTKKAVQQAR